MPTATPIPVSMSGFVGNINEGVTFMFGKFGTLLNFMQTHVVMLLMIGLLFVSIIIGLVLKVRHGV